MTPDELVLKAKAMEPTILAVAEEAEQNRMLPPEIIEEIQQNGFFRILMPKRFGGYEYDLKTAVRCSLEFGIADASTSWIFGIVASENWLISLFPLQCQEDVWGDNPDAFTVGSYAPAGTCVRVDGGYRITGTWHYASGCDYADWCLMGVLFPPDDGGGSLEPGMVLVPKCDFGIIDTWRTMGLAATGSRSLVCEDAFVPEHRRVTFEELSTGNSPGLRIHQSPLYRYPLLSIITHLIVTPAIGALEGAIESFIQDAKARETRGAVALGGSRMIDFQSVQMRVGEAAAALRAARAMLFHQIEESYRTIYKRGERLDVRARLDNRITQAFTTKLALQGLDALWGAAGGSGIQLSQRVQRAWRDSHAVAHHIAFNWDALSSMYGQHLLGLEPRGQY